MKKLLFIPMLFACFMGMGQAAGGGGKHFIGEKFGGGIVFNVTEDGLHGLIAAKSDQSQSKGIEFGPDTDKPITTEDGFGAGLKNTEIIMAKFLKRHQWFEDNAPYAAKLCKQYKVIETLGGIRTTYGDWYLPSKYELNLLYLQKDKVGGFEEEIYWSSTENEYDTAWGKSFNELGIESFSVKNSLYHVRAIKSF